MSFKREREEDGEVIVGETMCIMPIGAGNEVGRSCIILKYMGKTIMLDCGIHPVSK
jgi:cleavage and polyadenylation specificity factor subunit 3